jgi:type I restriction enzyme S subunit
MSPEALPESLNGWPSGWQVVRLADAGRWLSGGTPSTSNDEFWGGAIPWISAASLKKFRIDTSDRKITEAGAINGTRLVPQGTVLFVVRGMSLNNEFRIGVTARQVAFGQDCKAIIPAEGIDSTFLAHAVKVRSPAILRLVETTSHGTGRLDTGRLGELELGIPPISEQRRIVDAIAAVSHDIDVLQRRIGKLDVIEGEMVATCFRDLLNEKGEWRYLEEVADVAAGVTLGSEALGDGSIELPYLRVANVLDGRIDTADLKTVRIFKTQMARFSLRPGDVLLTEGGDLDKLGRGAVWDGRIDPCLHQNHIFRVRCGPDMIPEYLVLYVASAEGRRYFMRVGKQSTNLASINSTQVKRMPVPVPSAEDQKRLLAPVGAIRTRVQTLQAKADKLRIVRDALAEDLLSGKVRVDDL